VRTLLALLLLLTAGCSSGIAVDTYPMEAGNTLDCKALFADSPRQVAGLGQVLVADRNAAAWGDPAIILRCGVERPSALGAAPRCETVADVGWFGESIAGGRQFTTVGRKFFVSVEVPAEHDPASNALADLANTVQKHDPLLGPC